MNDHEKIAVVEAHDFLSALVRWGADEDSNICEILDLAFMAREVVDNLAEVFPDVLPVEDEQEVVT